MLFFSWSIFFLFVFGLNGELQYYQLAGLVWDNLPSNVFWCCSFGVKSASLDSSYHLKSYASIATVTTTTDDADAHADDANADADATAIGYLVFEFLCVFVFIWKVESIESYGGLKWTTV